VNFGLDKEVFRYGMLNPSNFGAKKNFLQIYQNIKILFNYSHMHKVLSTLSIMILYDDSHSHCPKKTSEANNQYDELDSHHCLCVTLITINAA
jgi:hypothetical protein